LPLHDIVEWPTGNRQIVQEILLGSDGCPAQQSCPTRDQSLPLPTAMQAQKVGRFIQIRNVICVLCLIVFAIFETYTALGTALDNSRTFPAWHAKLGWGLLVLPSLLMTGLVLLLFGKRSRLGFSLVASSLLLYMGFLFLELALVGRIDRTDWVVVGIWVTLCATALAAAWFLRRRTALH
jgi:hypothetical protein